MPRGSLHDLLHGAAGVVVDTAQAVRFALDIARGMAFLHSLERIIPEYHLNSFHVMVSIDFFVTFVQYKTDFFSHTSSISTFQLIFWFFL